MAFMNTEIGKIRSVLDRKKRELARAELEYESARSAVEQKRGEVAGLVALLLELGEPSKDSGSRRGKSRESSGGAITDLSRSKAMVMLMRREDRPMSPSEMSRLLKAEGRQGDEPRYISSNLDRLKRSGRARPLGDGTWVLVDDRDTSDIRTLSDMGGDA